MEDLIRREDVLNKLYLDHKDVTYIDKNAAAERIKKIQSIDIVRCKECKHWDTADGECYADRGIYFPKADDFCSYGEREGE